MNIANAVVIVTGASSGIGKATAQLLGSRGARVALAARSKDILQALAKELPNSLVVQTDVSDKQSVVRMVKQVHAHYGRIDALINNAGRGLYGALEGIPADEYRHLLELNVVGPLIAMQQVIPHMRTQGGGAIVNISSMVSKMYIPYLSAYASTKYALNALSLTARAELQKAHIVVSTVYPGLTNTDFGKNAIVADTAGEMMRPRGRENLKADSPEFVAGRILYALKSGDAEVFMHQ